MKNELETKRLEMIGERFKYSYPETYALIQREFNCDSSYLVAVQLAEYFTQSFEQMREETQDEYEDWLCEQEAMLDPPMDNFDYLRREI